MLFFSYVVQVYVHVVVCIMYSMTILCHILSSCMLISTLLDVLIDVQLNFIIECDSTLYVGMTQKKNGGLYRTYITFSLKYP